MGVVKHGKYIGQRARVAARYPPNWPEISRQVRAAHNHRCGVCSVVNGVARVRDRRLTRVQIAVAHLDHDPQNNAPENLLPMCQPCHLQHDATLHAREAAKTRRLVKDKARPLLDIARGDEIREKAGELLDELLTFRLEVVLADAPETRHATHSCRVAVSTNPEWYRLFCRENPTTARSKRRRGSFQTIIKRQNTVEGLTAILAGATEGVYVERLIDFIERNYLRHSMSVEDIAVLVGGN